MTTNDAQLRPVDPHLMEMSGILFRIKEEAVKTAILEWESTSRTCAQLFTFPTGCCLQFDPGSSAAALDHNRRPVSEVSAIKVSAVAAVEQLRSVYIERRTKELVERAVQLLRTQVKPSELVASLSVAEPNPLGS